MSNDTTQLPPIGTVGAFFRHAISDRDGNLLCPEKRIPATVIGHLGYGGLITLSALANPAQEFDCHSDNFQPEAKQP